MAVTANDIIYTRPSTRDNRRNVIDVVVLLDKARIPDASKGYNPDIPLIDISAFDPELERIKKGIAHNIKSREKIKPIGSEISEWIYVVNVYGIIWYVKRIIKKWKLNKDEWEDCLRERIYEKLNHWSDDVQTLEGEDIEVLFYDGRLFNRPVDANIQFGFCDQVEMFRRYILDAALIAKTADQSQSKFIKNRPHDKNAPWHWGIEYNKLQDIARQISREFEDYCRYITRYYQETDPLDETAKHDLHKHLDFVSGLVRSHPIKDFESLFYDLTNVNYHGATHLWDCFTDIVNQYVKELVLT